jgi:gliding motility-associated-like protein
VACSSDLTGATISVDDPGAGNLIVWYEDAGGVTAATGVTGGSNGNQFTPTSNATFTYFTINESQIGPTNCESVNSLAVQHTQDLLPTAGDADLDDDASLLETCTDQLLLGATATDNGGTGTWTYPGLLFYEDFNGFSDGTYQSLGTFGWSRDISATAFDGTDHFEVKSNAFEGNDLDGEAIWTSATINVSAIVNFNISIEASEVGDHEPADYVQLTYQIDANPEQIVGTVTGNFTSSPISGTFATGGGTNMVIRVKVLNNANAEFLSFDNISLVDAAATTLTFNDIHDENAIVSGLPVATTTLTWSVASALGSCSPSTETVDIIRNALPDAFDITPELCEDLPQGSDVVVGVDLTIALYSDAVTGIIGSINRTIEYFDDPARMPIDAVPDPTNVDISDTEVIYLRVTDTGTSVNTMCTQDATIKFTVSTLPDAIDQNAGNNAAETVFCEETVASLNTKDNIDLTTLDDNVSNGAINRSVEWFMDPGGAPATRGDLTGFEVPVDTGVDGVSDGDIFYAIVVNTITLCEDISQVEFTINPRPADNPVIAPDGTTPASVSLCKSNSVLFFQVDEAQTPGSSYNWTIPTGVGELVLVGGGGVNDFFVLLRAPNTILTPGVALSVQEISTDGCAGNVNTINVIVDDAPPAPVIVGDQDVCTNEQNVVYSIATPVVGSTYTWSIGALGSIVSGQGDPLIIVNIGVTSASITVTELNATGCTSPAAAPYPVTVRPRPTMTSPTTLELCSGEQVNDGTVGANLILTSSIGGSSFAWVVNSKTGSVGGTAVGNSGPGQINQTLTNTSGAPGSVTYEITPTSPAPGLCVGPTQVVTITVDPEPVGANITRAVECSNVAFSVSPDNITNGLGGTSTYSWVRNALPAGLTQITAGTGTGMIAETLQNLTSGTLNAVYVVTPESSDNCLGTPYNVTIRIGPQPVGAAITRANQCSDVAFSVSADNITNGIGGTSTYTWVRNALPAGLTEITAGTGTGAIAETLQNLTNATINATYVVTPKSGDGCDGNTYTITVPIGGEPVQSNLTDNECSDVAIGTLLPATDNDGGAITSYDVTAVVDPDLAGVATTGAGTANVNFIAADVFTNLTNTGQDVVYTVTPYFGTCAGTNFTITVTIDPEPVQSNLTDNECSDVAIGTLLPATDNDGGAITSYDVTAVVDPDLAGAATTGAGTANVNFIAADVFTNLTNVGQDVVYTVTPYFGTCAGTDFTVTVTIDPEPVQGNLVSNECSDVAIGFVLPATDTDGGAITSYDIAAVVDPDLAGAASTVAGTANVNFIAADVFTNLTNVGQDVVYTVTPYFGTCAGTDFTVTVTIDPEPVQGNLVSNECSDVAIGFVLPATDTDGGAITSYDISVVVDPDLAGAASTVTGTANVNFIAADVFTNLTNVGQDVVYTVTPYFGTCAGTDFTVTVTIDPEPVQGNLVSNECSDVAIGFVLPATDTDGGAITSYDIAAVVDPDLAGAASTVAGTANVNFIAADVFTNLTNVGQDVVYTVTPYFGTCAGTDFTVTVTIDPEPVQGNLVSNECSDVAIGFVLPATDTDGGAITSYDISVVVDPDLAGAASTVAGTANVNFIAADVFTNLTNVSQDVVYTVTPYFGTCAGTDFTVTVTIDPEPVQGNLVSNECSDVAIGFVLPATDTDGGAITSYDIAAVVDPDLAGAVSTVTGTANVNFIAADVFTNLTNVGQDVVYTVTPYFGTCAGTDFTVTVTIDPEPVQGNLVSNECSDVAIGFVLPATDTDGGAITSYNISAVVDPDLAGAASTVAGTANVNFIAADVFTNLTNVGQDVVYTVTPYFGTCVGSSFTITVTIDPEPVGFYDTRNQCSDATLSYNLQTLNINNTGSGGNSLLSQFTYTVGSNNAGVAAATARGAASIDPITDSYINDTGTDAVITYEVTPFGLIDGCEGDKFTVAFTYSSKPKGFDHTQVTCSDVPLNYNIQAQNIDDATNGNSVPSDFTYTVNSSSGSVPAKPNRSIKSDLPITDNYTNTTGAPVFITYTITPISKGTNCPGVPFDVVFAVNSEPQSIDATVNVCGGGAVNYSLQLDGIDDNGILSKFYYTVSSSSPGDVTPDPGRPFGSASTLGISTAYTNLSGAPVIITYTVTPIANDATICEGNPFTVKFNIIPGPLGIDDNDEEVCSGEQINYDIQTDNIDNGGNNIPGRFTYVVSSSNEAVVPTPAALDRTVASDLPITDTFNNTSAGDVTVTYRVTPISLSGGCVGSAFDVEFIIHPAPLGGDDLTGILCSGDAINYDIQVDNIDNLNALPSEFTYVVTSSDQPNVPAAADRVVFSNAIINDTYVNTTSSAVNIDYIITSREIGLNNCVGSPFIVRFKIDPEPVLNPVLDNTVCSQENTVVVLSTNGTSVSATSYNIGNVTIDPSLTPLPGNVVFPQNGVNANYIRFDKYKNTTNGSLTVQYEVTPVSNKGCLGDLVVVEVTILPEPVLDPALSPTAVCSGDLPPVGFVLSEEVGSVAAATYNLNGISIPGGLTAMAGNATIGDGKGATVISNDRYINTTSVALQVTYTITPVTAAGCEGEDQTVTFTINPAPALAILNDIVCSNAAIGLTLATLPSSAPATDYEIMDIRPAAGLVVGANAGTGTTNNVNYLSADVFINTTNGVLNVEYDIVPISGPGCRGPQVTAVIRVEPEITIITPGLETLCSGDATSIELRSNTIPSSGNITFDVFATASDPLVNGYTVFSQNLPNNAVAPFYTITDNIINNSDVVQTVTYEITPRAFGANNGATCSAPVATLVTVTIMPKPKVTASQSFVTICEGQNLDIDLTTSTSITPGTIEFEITSAVATGGVTGFSPVGTIFVNNDKLLDGLDNPTTSNQTVTYTITPRATGTAAGVCSGTPINIVVTVFPRPTVTPSLTDLQICSGEIVNILLPTNVTNSIAAWTVSNNVNVIGQFDGLGKSLFQSLINTTSQQQVLTYTVEPFLLLDNSCTGNSVVIKVTIDPVPDVIITDSQLSICSGETLNILLDGNSPNTTYDVVATSSNSDIDGYESFTATNGDFLNQTIVHSGTAPGSILYIITPRIVQPVPDSDPCKGLPQVIIVTVSPPIGAQIVTDDEILCTGNSKAIEFEMQGSAPFKLTLEKTDNHGTVTIIELENLASRHVILTTETVSYRIIKLEDFYNCVVNPVDEVTILFELAEADFTINGSKNPAPVTLDFNTGTVDIEIALSNYNENNTYNLAIGDENIPVTAATFTYTFNKPSDFGTLGFSAVLKVEAPSAFNCNDVENIFIEVLPAQPTVVAFADVLEGCPPFTVNFESFREDLSLSKNIIVENLIWDFDGTKINAPNPTFTFTQSGIYNVLVTGDNGHGDEAFDNIVITVFQEPFAEFLITQTVVYIPDDGFRPTNRSKGATQFDWDFGDFNTSMARSPEHFYEEEGVYDVVLTATNDFGCVDTDIDKVTVKEGGFTKTPNAFTPNINGPSGGGIFDPNVPGSGDSANDIFLPITIGIMKDGFKMYIYDRWGNLIFYSDNPQIGWDGYNSKGQLLPAGVYIYKLDLLLSDGQRTQRVGDVTLIR